MYAYIYDIGHYDCGIDRPTYPGEIFCGGPLITLWQSIQSTQPDDAYSLHLHFFAICMGMLWKPIR